MALMQMSSIEEAIHCLMVTIREIGFSFVVICYTTVIVNNCTKSSKSYLCDK